MSAGIHQQQAAAPLVIGDAIAENAQARQGATTPGPHRVRERIRNDAEGIAGRTDGETGAARALPRLHREPPHGG